jgi:hypothetical protein
MGNYRYYLCQKNLIGIDELPDGWGLLYLDGKRVLEVKESSGFTVQKNNELIAMISMVRRLQRFSAVSIVVDKQEG